MPIPRPANLKPPKFEAENWLSPGAINAGYQRAVSKLPEAIKKAANPQYPEFLWRTPHVHGEDGKYAEWEGVRFLGAGNFGRVGLWQRKSGTTVVDEMAIKEAVRAEDYEEYEVRLSNGELCEGLLLEAAVNADLNNQQNSHHISFLRSFKYYPDCGERGKYRSFLNYCPFDSLETLAAKYKMWDRWLPELFLWHTLIQLLKGVQVLEQLPPRETIVDNPGKGCFVLHLDLKPENIFLDYGEDEDGASNAAHYPDIRIADFGLSEYTNNADSTNPDRWGPSVGTPGYQPPEQTQLDTKWGADFTKRLFAPTLRWERQHNLWAVGKIMYDIMTHEKPGRCDDWILDTTERQYKIKGNHFLSKDWIQIWTSNLQYYEEDVMELQEEALKSDEDDQVNRQNGGGNASEDTNGSVDEAERTRERRKKQREADRRTKKQEVLEEWRKKEQSTAEAAAEQYQAMVQHWHYSEPLTTVVWELLKPVPRHRPTSIRTLEMAVAGRQEYLESVGACLKRKRTDKLTAETLTKLPPKVKQDTRLYYRGHEINETAAGRGAYLAEQKDYDKLEQKADPNGPLLRPPQDKWKDIVSAPAPRLPTWETFNGGISRPVSNPLVRLRSPDITPNVSSGSKRSRLDLGNDLDDEEARPMKRQSKGKRKAIESVDADDQSKADQELPSPPQRPLKVMLKINQGGVRKPASKNGDDNERDDQSPDLATQATKRRNKGKGKARVSDNGAGDTNPASVVLNIAGGDADNADDDSGDHQQKAAAPSTRSTKQAADPAPSARPRRQAAQAAEKSIANLAKPKTAAAPGQRMIKKQPALKRKGDGQPVHETEEDEGSDDVPLRQSKDKPKKGQEKPTPRTKTKTPATNDAPTSMAKKPAKKGAAGKTARDGNKEKK